MLFRSNVIASIAIRLKIVGSVMERVIAINVMRFGVGR